MAARKDFEAALGKSSVARYIQLAALFRKNIDHDVWPVGCKMPTVEQLAKEFGVAGMTIRQALDILENNGLIERFRAKGTFVTAKSRTDLWCEVQTDWQGLLMAGSESQITLLAQEMNVTLPPVDSAVGTPAPAYRHLQRLHSREGEPFLFANIYIDERLTGQISDEMYSTTTAMQLVANLDGVNIVDARQVLTVDIAGLELCTQLNLAIGDPVVSLVRLAIDETGTIVLVAFGNYRGDRVRIDMKLMS